MLADAVMPEGWRLEPLGNLADYVNGRAFKPEEWGEAGLPIIRIEQMTNPEAECDYFNGVLARDHMIDDGDLLFSWSATLTTLVWDRGPAALNQHIFKVLPRPGTNRYYLHHLLNFLIEKLAGQAHGSTMRHIKKSDLLPYTVYVSPLREQRRIAEILNAADAAIGETEALISKLKQIKTGLTHDLLAHGVDERGQLRDPETHSAQFKESPLGRIPREWDICPLGEEITLQRGFDITAKVLRPGNIPIVSSSGVTAFHDTAMVNGPGVITGRKGKLGDVFYVEGPYWPHDTTLWVKDFYDNDPKFVYRFLSGMRLQRMDASTANPTLNRNFVHPILVAFPPSVEQQRIAEILDAHDDRIGAEEAYRDKLKLQKKGLIEDLLTGKVRIKATEEANV